MKSAFLIAAILSAMLAHPGPAAPFFAVRDGLPFATSFEACPEVPLKITDLTITPKTPASQHKVKVNWTDVTPACFDRGTFIIQGTVTFASNAISTFSMTFENPQGGQNVIEIPVDGLAAQSPINPPSSQLAPIKVSVQINVRQVASVSGASNSFTLPGSSPVCPAQVAVNVTSTTMTGLSPIPNRPGTDFHPKVKVDWEVANLFSCFVLTRANVSVTLKAGGKTYRAHQSRDGTAQSSMTLLVESVAVGANFQPDEIRGTVTVLGAAQLTGMATKEILVN